MGVDMSSTSALVISVAAWTVLSLVASSVLIVRLERLGGHFGVTEASLGLIAALAADTPEITAAVTALSRGQHDVGIGVVLGSNVFNLAALLGLSAVVAGRITFHRSVVLVEGAVGVWLALVCLVVVLGPVPPALGLAAALVVFVPYTVLTTMHPARRAQLPIPRPVRALLLAGVADAELDVAAAEHDVAQISDDQVHPRRDAVQAAIAVLVVVFASVRMVTGMTDLGARWGLSSAVVGAVILAAMTSLPNAVAAVYLARRGRGAATLSEAMNSNTINSVVGFLLPATLIGLGTVSAASRSVAGWYVALTLATLATAYLLRGVTRLAGLAVIAAYAVFVALI